MSFFSIFLRHGQLVILSTEASDSGSYRARATNTQLGKEENSAWVRLKVESGPDDFSEVISIKHNILSLFLY